MIATGTPIFSFDFERDLRVAADLGVLAPVAGVPAWCKLTKHASAADLRVCLQHFPPPTTAGFDARLDAARDAVTGLATNVSGTIALQAGSPAVRCRCRTHSRSRKANTIVVRVESDFSFTGPTWNCRPQTSPSQLRATVSVSPSTRTVRRGSCTQDPDAIESVVLSTTGFGASAFPAPSALGHAFVAPDDWVHHRGCAAPPAEPSIYAIRSDRRGVIVQTDCRSASCAQIGKVFRVETGESVTFELVTQSGSTPT